MVTLVPVLVTLQEHVVVMVYLVSTTKNSSSIDGTSVHISAISAK